jgi:hypothetical protein
MTLQVPSIASCCLMLFFTTPRPDFCTARRVLEPGPKMGILQKLFAASRQIGSGADLDRYNLIWIVGQYVGPPPEVLSDSSMWVPPFHNDCCIPSFTQCAECVLSWGHA